MNDSVSMPAQGTARGSEGERLGWRKLEANNREMPACAFFEIVPAVEDLARSGREHRPYPPVKLGAPRASVSNNTCA